MDWSLYQSPTWLTSPCETSKATPEVAHWTRQLSQTQKNMRSRGFSSTAYLSLNSFLVNHRARGMMVSFISMMPLFFWSMWEASTTMRFRYSIESAPARRISKSLLF